MTGYSEVPPKKSSFDRPNFFCNFNSIRPLRVSRKPVRRIKLGFKKKLFHCKRFRKNRKNNKSNKIQDLEKEEAKKGLEMSANVAKIAKVTRIFLASEELASQISQKSQE